jgi:hypothetical protein
MRGSGRGIARDEGPCRDPLRDESRQLWLCYRYRGLQGWEIERTRRRDKLVVVGDRRVVYKSVCDHCVLQEAFYSSDFQSFSFILL